MDNEKPENYYTRDELISTLDHVDISANSNWYSIFRLLAFSGCGKVEILALTSEDLNFKKNTLCISKTLSLGPENKLIIQPLKTKKNK